MSTEFLSIREASDLLGVSQLRVRELIRKGKLEAEKLAEQSGDRWSIRAESAHGWMRERTQSANGHAAEASSNGHAMTPALIAGLERQLGRVRALLDELGRAQAYVDGLRKAQAALESELRTLREAPSPAPSAPSAPSAPPAPPAPSAPPAPPAPPASQAESVPDTPEKPARAPRTRAPKATGTALEQALQDAGVPTPKPPRARRPAAG